MEQSNPPKQESYIIQFTRRLNFLGPYFKKENGEHCLGTN